jgi:GNAT superfamily N-acetyltransferase
VEEAGLNLGPPEPLAPDHRVDAFRSGEPSLDAWLLRRAAANQHSGASRTFVACHGRRVGGFYALASSAVTVAAASGRFRRNMPDPIPVVILARLAVDQVYQGRGVGRALFQDAALRVIAAADTIGIRGLLVHAITDQAAAFYRSLGLSPSPLDPQILMVTLADLRGSLRT